MKKPPPPVVQTLLLQPLNDALALGRRFQEGASFQAYVMERLVLLVPIGVLMVITSVACAAATILFVGGTRSLLVLLALLLVPFVLVGSFLVQTYVFLSWLEGRALAKALHRSDAPPGPIAARLRRLGIDMGSPPPVPWAFAAVFLLLPLLMLLAVAPKWGWALVLLLIAAPIVFARLDP